ncbi:hypothetical protein [Ruminococcus sp.]|uniref:hypothetical protein n=1 Tax=Ruminococcus sp. TaxID=41978 RepID=UPI001B699876|nr:hypothetical protein [Ruminococcus sp.]MBP5431550.1 hypothetical protein [Ruminococcus sp.]
MNSEAIFNAAHSTAIRLLESGAFISPEDTVCSIESASGRIYTGISRADMTGIIHAEADAVMNMQAAGESAIAALLLISTQSRTHLLPCNNCIGYILSLDPSNVNCMILMQDRPVSITEVGRFAAPCESVPEPQNFSAPPYQQYQQYQPYSSAAPVNQTADAEKDEAQKKSLNSVSIAEILEVSAEVEANNQSSNGSILKERVKDILKAAEDDTDEFLNSLPPPNRHSGFFRK